MDAPAAQSRGKGREIRHWCAQGHDRSRRAARAAIGVEVAAIAARRHVTGANAEVAEALGLLPLTRVCGKQRVERGNDAGVVEVLGIKLVHARAVEGGADIKIVAAGPFADQTDL